MSKESEIMREHIRTHRTVLSMCNEPEDVILNRLLDDFDSKEQRIAELEEQLKNAIVLPKYEKGQKIYYIYGENIKEAYFQSFAEDIWVEAILNPQEITDEDGYTEVDFDVDMIYYKNSFATKEEAEARLRELQENEKID